MYTEIITSAAAPAPTVPERPPCVYGSNCSSPFTCGWGHSQKELEVYHVHTQEQSKADREYAQEKRVEDARKLSAVSDPLRAVYHRGPPFLPHDPKVDRPLLFATVGNPMNSIEIYEGDGYESSTPEPQRSLPSAHQPAKNAKLISVLGKKPGYVRIPPLEKVVAAPKQVVKTTKQLVANPKAAKKVMAGAKASVQVVVDDDEPTYSPMREGPGEKDNVNRRAIKIFVWMVGGARKTTSSKIPSGEQYRTPL